MSAWQTWNVFQAATGVFTRLSAPVSSITDDELSIIEEFVVIMYDQASETNYFDEARLDLFARKQRQYNAVPPSSAALVQHVKRSVLHAGNTWGQTLSRIQNLPTPSNWGWKKENDVEVPHWTSLAPIAASSQELLKCGCKKNCSGNCKCFRSGLTCTALYSCTCSEGNSHMRSQKMLIEHFQQ
jgi:hypothetical protein